MHKSNIVILSLLLLIFYVESQSIKAFSQELTPVDTALYEPLEPLDPVVIPGSNEVKDVKEICDKPNLGMPGTDDDNKDNVCCVTGVDNEDPMNKKFTYGWIPGGCCPVLYYASIDTINRYERGERVLLIEDSCASCKVCVPTLAGRTCKFPFEVDASDLALAALWTSLPQKKYIETFCIGKKAENKLGGFCTEVGQNPSTQYPWSELYCSPNCQIDIPVDKHSPGCSWTLTGDDPKTGKPYQREQIEKNGVKFYCE